MDTRGTGIVWYRSTTDPEIILRVRNEIAAAFPQLSTSFIAQEVVVTTWDHVGYFARRTDLVIIIILHIITLIHAIYFVFYRQTHSSVS